MCIEEEINCKFFRFKREEMKIQAWENHQKAKMEAEMRKIEVKEKKKNTSLQWSNASLFCKFSLTISQKLA